MKKVFTFNAKSISVGTVSVEADTLEEAKKMIDALEEAGTTQFNACVGEGYNEIELHGRIDADADDGTHMWATSRQNAQENAIALDEIAEETEESDELGRDFLENKAALGE